MKLLTLLMFFLSANLWAEDIHKLDLGKSVTLPSGLKLTLESFKTHKPECAVPGFNCGAGYFPKEFVQPIIKIDLSKDCQTYPLPEACEETYQIKDTDNKSYVTIQVIRIFDQCEEDTNTDNRYSCIIRIARNAHDRPAFRHQNCERIKTSLERRDACYEAIAGKEQDVKLCDLVKGQETFECIYLRATIKKDPEVCKTLKMNRFHHTKQAHLDQIDACMNSPLVKKSKTL